MTLPDTMLPINLHLVLLQLNPRKGGYHYLPLDATIVNQFPNGKATRLLCTLDGHVTFPCGLNHSGDGNFYIIVSKRYLKNLATLPGDSIEVLLEQDPNPLGVDVPEVLEVLLAQDEEARAVYERLTDGRKRTLIHSIARVKDLDRQVRNITEFLEKEAVKQQQA